MNTNPPRFHDWAKQIAVWLAITTLLPFTAYFSVQAFTKCPTLPNSTASKLASTKN